MRKLISLGNFFCLSSPPTIPSEWIFLSWPDEGLVCFEGDKCFYVISGYSQMPNPSWALRFTD